MENGAIALLLVVAMGVLFWRLSLRGPSRMRNALYTIGAFILALWLIAIVVNMLTGPVPT